MSLKKRNDAPAILKGWKAIGAYLGIGMATAQHWGRSGMPVKREGRYTVADKDEISRWLAQQSHMPAPAHVASADTDIAAALKESITALRKQKSKP